MNYYVNKQIAENLIGITEPECQKFSNEAGSGDESSSLKIYQGRHFWLFLCVIISIAVLSFGAIYILNWRKEMQPLRKISPGLMIVSVVGNFLCIFNICNCLMFFEMFIAR